MMPRLLVSVARFVPLLLLGWLAGCTTESSPLKLYLIGSSRFTSGNKTSQGAGDTLAARVYVVADSLHGQGLQKLHVQVTYSPSRQPFAYQLPLTSFQYRSLPTGQEIAYLDTVFQAPYPANYLLTTVFGVRTTAGSENWQYTATDATGRTSARSFIITVRRSDSTLVYHDYYLRLSVPARGVSARRFLQLKSGLALPSYAVLGTSTNPTPDQQAFTDAIQSVDGLGLYSPDVVGNVVSLPATRWPVANRRKTRFSLTTLTPTSFASLTDTLGIRQQFVAPGTSSLTGLVVGQVYAFRRYPLASAGAAPSVFGLLRVVSVPGGTTAGLQLEVRLAKQPQATAFTD